MSDYPEHDKLSKISDESQAIGQFIDWLSTQKMTVAEWIPIQGYRDDQLTPMSGSITELLAAYYGIDLGKIESEKRQMLETMRSAR